MSPRYWLGLGVLYLCGHFIVYAVILRHVPTFSSEKAIFRYHALSAVALGGFLAAAVVFLPRPPSAAVLVGVMSLYGIYSLSFLELWTLTEGSYSLTILAGASGGGDPGKLGLIGETKRARRIESLRKLGLARLEGGRIVLTGSGCLAARGVRFILWLVNATSPE